jgi:hypothetical protein
MFRCLAVSVLLVCLAGPALGTDFGVEGTRFTLDGKPTFLLGISYYGALGAPEAFIERDLEDMGRLGINWIRVWATWAAFENDVTAFDDRGEPREPYFSRLEWLVAECDRRGVVVDVTLTRGNRVVGKPRIRSLASHRRAVETVVSRLKPHRNWYLDLGNERNIRDKRFVEFDELVKLREAARRVDPGRLVTASHAGDVPPDDLEAYVKRVGVDFLSPHRPRNARSPNETEERSRRYLAKMAELGRVVPLHYQEPFRRGFTRGWEPTADDYVTDARAAAAGGAAGWCLHNGDQRHEADQKPRRSFDMRKERLFDQLDEVEREALDRLHKLLADGKE